MIAPRAKRGSGLLRLVMNSRPVVVAFLLASATVGQTSPQNALSIAGNVYAEICGGKVLAFKVVAESEGYAPYIFREGYYRRVGSEWCMLWREVAPDESTVVRFAAFHDDLGYDLRLKDDGSWDGAVSAHQPWEATYAPIVFGYGIHGHDLPYVVRAMGSQTRAADGAWFMSGTVDLWGEQHSAELRLTKREQELFLSNYAWERNGVIATYDSDDDGELGVREGVSWGSLRVNGKVSSPSKMTFWCLPDGVEQHLFCKLDHGLSRLAG